MKLLTIIGTRPEAIKMAPVLRALSSRPNVTSMLALTGQHRDLVEQPLQTFGIAADFDLEVRSRSDNPLAFVADASSRLARLLAGITPDRVIVQGDTASAIAGAEAARLGGVALTHVEAGLRTHSDLPWPEEPFRKRIDELADQLLAPTPLAAANLRAEGLAGDIHVTGNSGIDALHALLESQPLAVAGNGPPQILVTLHRRENIGAGADALCMALREIVETRDVRVVFPLHPNPLVHAPIRAALGSAAKIALLPPQDPFSMLRMMQDCALVLTDSGGLQEEAPSLGKPVLILRDVTERPEGVVAGIARLVGTRTDAIIDGVEAMLERPPPPIHANPYGDGRASARIVSAILGEPFEPFEPLLPVAHPANTVASA